MKFLGWFEDDDHIFIAMEYFKHGTLDMFINPALVEQDVQTIALQLLEGLKIMHEEQFTHRDLKPQVSRRFLVKNPGVNINRTYSSCSTRLTGGSR